MRKRMTPGLVLGIVALVIAMTGSAVGASLITGKQIKNNTITGKDVKNKSLTKKDFKGSVRGATGPQGPPGATGATGPAGPSDLATLTDNYGTLEVAAGESDGGTLDCDPGQKIVSGGFDFSYPAADDKGGRIVASEATETLDGWLVVLDNRDGTATATLGADALCASAGKAVATPSRGKQTLRRTAESRRIVAGLR